MTATAASASAINLSWIDNASNEDGFLVERSADNVTFVQIGQTATDVVTYADTGLAAGTLYYYQVRAFNAGGNSAYTGVASATTQAVPVAAPVLPGKPLMTTDGQRGGYLLPARWGAATEPPLPPKRGLRRFTSRRRLRQLSAVDDDLLLAVLRIDQKMFSGKVK